jgi:hypothetical protein
MNNPTRKSISIKSLRADYDLNIRLRENYDIPTMVEQIKAAGRVTDPLFIRGEDNTVLRGNRRYWACMWLLEQPDTAPELREAISKLDCIVYTGLSEKDTISLILDHGQSKNIARSEIVQAVWRLDMQFYSEAQIIGMMFYALAAYTKNTQKLAEMPDKPGKERDAFLKKWLHGTVGNQMLAAAKMGSYVKQQFFLTRKAEDHLLLPERKVMVGGVEATLPAETVEMKCSTTRITELSAAKSADLKAGGWTPENGGEAFNKLIEKFKAEDRGEQESDKVARPTTKELREKADQFSSPAIRNALLVAAGDQDAGRGLVEMDDRLKRLTMVMDTLRAACTTVTDPNVKGLLEAIVSDTLPAGEVDVRLKPFTTAAS